MSAGPCRCWTETWSPHDGHCCFHPNSPEDCHDAEAEAQRVAAERHPHGGRGWSGHVMDRRYWLTEAGWLATGGLPR